MRGATLHQAIANRLMAALDLTAQQGYTTPSQREAIELLTEQLKWSKASPLTRRYRGKLAAVRAAANRHPGRTVKEHLDWLRLITSGKAA